MTHPFALLNLLKRICDHPALVLNKIEDYQSFESGKWELFQELLFETLDSGQKIVVFTQYLGMIAMMEHLLTNLGIPFVALTGASENRGEIVRRFNEDQDCRVLLGSLKAGGTGIDLVGGINGSALRSLVERRARRPGNRSRAPYRTKTGCPGLQTCDRRNIRGKDSSHHRAKTPVDERGDPD